MKSILILFVLISTLIFADNTVQIKVVKAGDNILVSGNNTNPFSVTVTYEADIKNLSTDVKMPILFVMQPHSKIEVLKLHIDENGFFLKPIMIGRLVQKMPNITTPMFIGFLIRLGLHRWYLKGTTENLPILGKVSTP